MPEDLAPLVREHDRAIQRIETTLDQWRPIAEQRGVDVEALKLSTQETKVTQRLTVAMGGLLGTALVSLVIFAATRA